MRVGNQLWKQGCRESYEIRSPRTVERTNIHTELWKQGSRNSCENKGPATVVSRKVKGDLWEQGCRERGKKGSGKVLRTRVLAVENKLWEEDCTGSVSCSIRHQWQTASLNTLLKDNSKNYVMYLAWGLALFHCTGGMGYICLLPSWYFNLHSSVYSWWQGACSFAKGLCNN